MKNKNWFIEKLNLVYQKHKLVIEKQEPIEQKTTPPFIQRKNGGVIKNLGKRINQLINKNYEYNLQH